MQAKQEQLNKDWHQQLLMDLFQSPAAVKTRLGFALCKVGALLKFNLTDSFPVTTAKKLHFDQVIRELYCFLKGYTSADDLHRHGVKIWDGDLKRANATDIGPIYGHQWRNWGSWYQGADKEGFDQLRWAVDELIRTKGTTRRAIVSAWNAPEVLSEAAILPPCHVLFQFNILQDRLYTDVYQRSADVFLGLPFDVACFGIISRLVANECNLAGLTVDEEHLNYHLSNYHLYSEHLAAAQDEVTNEPSGEKPRLICERPLMGIDDFEYKYCRLEGYNETRFIKAKLLTDETNE